MTPRHGKSSRMEALRLDIIPRHILEDMREERGQSRCPLWWLNTNDGFVYADADSQADALFCSEIEGAAYADADADADSDAYADADVDGFAYQHSKSDALSDAADAIPDAKADAFADADGYGSAA